MLVAQSDSTFALARASDDGAAAPAPLSTPLASKVAAGLALSLYDSLRAVEPLWRAFEQTADCTAFQAFDWHDAWQKSVGALTGARPAILVARAGDRVVAIVPLQVEAGRFVSVLRWHASDLCDYNVPLLAPDFPELVAAKDFGALFTAAVALIKGAPGLHFGAADLTKMPERVGRQPNPFMSLSTTLNQNGAYATPLFGTWEEFYAEKRSSSTRRRDRTKRKRLGEIGEVAFVTAANAAGRQQSLATLMAQKGRAFAKTGVPDIFMRPGYRDFYMDIVSRRSADAGFAHVSQLTVAGAPTALNLGLMFRGAYYHVLASYDDGEASRFGPGAAHLHELMRYAIEHGCSTFDFTIGDERYKREWSDGVIRLHDHRCATSLLGRIVMFPAAVSAAAKRVIKQNPTLWTWAQKARAAIGKLRAQKAPAPSAADDDN